MKQLSYLTCVVLLLALAYIHAKSIALKEVDYNGLARFVKTNQLVFVFVSSTPCEYCGQYRNMITEVAQQFIGQISFFEIDSSKTENKQIVTTHHAQPPLSFLLFRDGQSQELQVNSGQALVDKLNKMLTPAIVNVDSKPKRESFLAQSGARVIAYFTETKGKEYEAFEKLARKFHPDVAFGLLTDQKQAKTLHFKKAPAVQLHKLNERAVTFASDEFDLPSLVSWLEQNKRLAVGELRTDNTGDYFGADAKVVCALFTSARDAGTQSLVKSLYSVAKKFASNDTIQFVWADPEQFSEQWLSHMGVDRAVLPAFVIMDTKSKAEYKFDGQFNADGLTSFVKQFEKGALVKKIKSAAAPANNNGPVKIVTANTYQDLVLQNDHDVLLEFWAPWCGHCKKLAPIYKQFAEALSAVDGVTIASFDAQDNDVPAGLDVKGFPTVLLFRAGAKTEPIVYEGGRTFDDLLKFMRQQSSKTIPDNIVAKESTL